MTASRGYGAWLDSQGNTLGETDLIGCCHCHRQMRTHNVDGTERELALGFCSLCNDKTCAACAKLARCIPHEKRIEAMESRGRLLAAIEAS